MFSWYGRPMCIRYVVTSVYEVEMEYSLVLWKRGLVLHVGRKDKRKGMYFNHVFLLLTHQGRQFDDCITGIVQLAGFGFPVSSWAAAKVAGCGERHTAFLGGSECSQAGSVAGTSSSLSWTTPHGAKAGAHCCPRQRPPLHLPSLHS